MKNNEISAVDQELMDQYELEREAMRKEEGNKEDDWSLWDMHNRASYVPTKAELKEIIEWEDAYEKWCENNPMVFINGDDSGCDVYIACPENDFTPRFNQ